MLNIVVLLLFYDFEDFCVFSQKCFALTDVLHAFDQILICLIFVEYFTINTRVHKRTLEGDSEKPSRHGNEGPLLMLPFYF